jgi:hypothetical protein
MMAVWSDMELRETGCVYNWRGIICKDRSKCEKCGWAPAVELERKAKFRKWCEENRNELGRV